MDTLCCGQLLCSGCYRWPNFLVAAKTVCLVLGEDILSPAPFFILGCHRPFFSCLLYHLHQAIPDSAAIKSFPKPSFKHVTCIQNTLTALCCQSISSLSWLSIQGPYALIFLLSSSLISTLFNLGTIQNKPPLGSPCVLFKIMTSRHPTFPGPVQKTPLLENVSDCFLLWLPQCFVVPFQSPSILTYFCTHFTSPTLYSKGQGPHRTPPARFRG